MGCDVVHRLVEVGEAVDLLFLLAHYFKVLAPALVKLPHSLLRAEVVRGELQAGGRRRLQQCQREQNT
jgi:hypothetical protein